MTDSSVLKLFLGRIIIHPVVVVEYFDSVTIHVYVPVIMSDVSKVDSSSCSHINFLGSSALKV